MKWNMFILNDHYITLKLFLFGLFLKRPTAHSCLEGEKIKSPVSGFEFESK